MDFNRRWSWLNLAEDESVFVNIFREMLSICLLKRNALLNDCIVSCCMLEFCGNALALCFHSQWSYFEGSSRIAEHHLIPLPSFFFWLSALPAARHTGCKWNLANNCPNELISGWQCGNVFPLPCFIFQWGKKKEKKGMYCLYY